MPDRRPAPRRRMTAAHPLARWRALRGLTQEQLAERADVGRITVARIENGAEPYVGTALRLATALDVRVEDIFTLEGSTPPSLDAAERRARRA